MLGELFLSRPMFPGHLSVVNSLTLLGKTDIAQMELIIKAVGIPSEETWPGVTELPLYSSIIATNQSSLTSLQTYSFCSPSIRVLLDSSII